MPKQAPILTVTLNPAVDVATTVAKVIAGPKLRCAPPRFDPGGGGVNVARTICKLGGDATALIAVGGAMGDRLLALLAAETVPTFPVTVSGETRQSFAVTEEDTGAQYRFGVPGQALNTADAHALLNAIAAQVTPGGYLVVSGSMAPGLPDGFLEEIIAVAGKAQVIIDTAGPALERLIAQRAAPVAVLRVDQSEAETIAGHQLQSATDTAAFGAELIAKGVAHCVVSGRGAQGSVMVTAQGAFLCTPPSVAERSRIGAGDAFVGAMTLAMARGAPPEAALQWGVAASSATVSTDATALCDLAGVTERLPACKVTRL